MSEFISKLEAVRDKGHAAVSCLLEFANAFDDFYAYCKEAHEAKIKPKQQVQQVKLEGSLLLDSYRNQV